MNKKFHFIDNWYDIFIHCTHSLLMACFLPVFCAFPFTLLHLTLKKYAFPPSFCLLARLAAGFFSFAQFLTSPDTIFYSSNYFLCFLQDLIFFCRCAAPIHCQQLVFCLSVVPPPQGSVDNSLSLFNYGLDNPYNDLINNFDPYLEYGKKYPNRTAFEDAFYGKWRSHLADVWRNPHYDS